VKSQIAAKLLRPLDLRFQGVFLEKRKQPGDPRRCKSD